MADVNVNLAPRAPGLYAPASATRWNNTWRQICQHFAPAILACARGAGLNDHSAEDVLQEVMTTLIRCQHSQAAGYDPGHGSFQAWLWGLIRNRVRSRQRQDQDQKQMLESQMHHAASEETSRGLPQAAQAVSEVERTEAEQCQRALLAAAMRRMHQPVHSRNFKIADQFTARLQFVADLLAQAGPLPSAPMLLWREPQGLVRHTLLGSELVVGRKTGGPGLSCPGDPWLSRRHFRIRAEGQDFAVRDLNSHNGTAINRTRNRIQGQLLRDGDLLFAGDHIFVFLDQSRNG